MSTDQTTSITRRRRWGMLLWCLLLGLVLAGAAAYAGQAWLGAVFFAIMAAYGLMLALLSPHHEAGDLMSGGAADERQAGLQQRAMAITGQVLTAALCIVWVWTIATDSAAQGIVTGLTALGGATWIASLIWLSRRG